MGSSWHPFAFHYCIPTQLFSSLVNNQNGKNWIAALTSQGSFSALCRMGPSLILDADVVLISVFRSIPKISHVTKSGVSVVILLFFISIYSGPCYIDVTQGHNKRNQHLQVSMFYDSLAIVSIFFPLNFLLLKSNDCWRQPEVFATGEGAASSQRTESREMYKNASLSFWQFCDLKNERRKKVKYNSFAFSAKDNCFYQDFTRIDRFSETIPGNKIFLEQKCSLRSILIEITPSWSSSYVNPLVLYYICTVRWHRLWHGEALQIR